MTEIETTLANAPDPAGTEDLIATFTQRAIEDGLVDVAWATVDSPCGELLVAGSEQGVVAIGLRDPDELLERIATKVSPRVVRAPARLDEPRRQLDEYFEGRRRSFELTLDWALSRGFRRAVLHELTKVGYGQVVTYRELAERTDSPRAVRAVGSAMATNPLPIVVPCHRVLRTGGDLGNYGGGVEMKRWLLVHEGALLT